MSKTSEILDRVKAPLPPFFRKLRDIGLALTATAGAILAAPIALPAILVTASGYLLVAGTVLTSVSQVTVQGSEY